MRSLWKGNFSLLNLWNVRLNKKKQALFFKRNIIITPLLLLLKNRFMKIHSGSNYVFLNIKSIDFCGHKVGEFIFTKKRGLKIHTVKKKKKK